MDGKVCQKIKPTFYTFCYMLIVLKTRGFELALKGGKKCRFCLGALQSLNAFVRLKATFSKH